MIKCSCNSRLKNSEMYGNINFLQQCYFVVIAIHETHDTSDIDDNQEIISKSLPSKSLRDLSREFSESGPVVSDSLRSDFR